MINAIKSFYDYVTSNITNEFYPTIAPKEATFPYCVYRYNMNQTDRVRKEIPINITIYDLRTLSNNNELRVMELIDKFDKEFNYCKFTDTSNDVIGEILKESPFMQSIPDPNPDVIRKEINFMLKYY